MKLGHDVLLLTEPGKPLEQAKKLGIPYNDEIRLNSRNVFDYLKTFKVMKHIFKEFEPDIISAHMNEGSWMAGMVARKFAPKAIIARIRTDIAAPKGHFINKYVHHKWTDHIIAGSEQHKSVCCKNLNYNPDNISVVYGSVDSDKFNPTLKATSSFRKEIGAEENDILAVLLGRLSPVKGHEYALKAISMLKDMPCKVKLVCLGYKSERTVEWIKSEAERLSISDRFIWVGRRDDLPSILSTMDIGLLTSIGSEANSRATLEYMASGLPVIGTAVGVVPELIDDGKTGFVVKPASAEDLADKIKILASDSNLRHQMGKAARKRIDDYFSLSEFGKQMESVYLKLVVQKV